MICAAPLARDLPKPGERRCDRGGNGPQIASVRAVLSTPAGGCGSRGRGARGHQDRGEQLMPRRTKAYIGPGKTLVNGGRMTEDENGPVTVLERVDLDIASIRKKVAVYIEKFD